MAGEVAFVIGVVTSATSRVISQKLRWHTASTPPKAPTQDDGGGAAARSWKATAGGLTTKAAAQVIAFPTGNTNGPYA
jgi:hypothetical protein